MQTTSEQTSPLIAMRRIQSAHASSRLSRGAETASSLADARRARSAFVQSHMTNGGMQRYGYTVDTDFFGRKMCQKFPKMYDLVVLMQFFVLHSLFLTSY